MTRRRVTMALVALGLAIPATAAAGGWATVSIDPPPGATSAGAPWNAELTLLQHGRTPLEGVRPAVIVTRTDGSGRRRFSAGRTGRPGVYRARVIFPTAGEWRYVVDDGFSAEHGFGPVSIRGAEAVAPAAPGGGDDGPGPWPAVAAIAAGLAALALAARAVGRRPRTAHG